MKILIIDDEILIQKSLSHIARIRGHFVHTAGTGQSGLKLWKSNQPDLIFLDLILPDQNGFSLIDQAPHPTFIVMMSAYSQYKEKAQRHGVDLFLTKPFENIFQTFDQVISDFNSRITDHSMSP